MERRQDRKRREGFHAVDCCAALAQQVALDGRYMMAQHFNLLQITAEIHGAAIVEILYTLAGNYGLVPDHSDIFDDDMPFYSPFFDKAVAVIDETGDNF